VDGSFVGFGPGFYAFAWGFVLRGVAEHFRGKRGLLVEDIVAQRGARQGAPAVVAGQGFDVAAQRVTPRWRSPRL
jgi:hypothetical protein